MNTIKSLPHTKVKLVLFECIKLISIVVHCPSAQQQAMYTIEECVLCNTATETPSWILRWEICSISSSLHGILTVDSWTTEKPIHQSDPSQLSAPQLAKGDLWPTKPILLLIWPLIQSDGLCCLYGWDMENDTLVQALGDRLQPGVS